MLRCLPGLLAFGMQVGMHLAKLPPESCQQSPKPFWGQEGWEAWLQGLAPSKHGRAPVGTGTNGVHWARGHPSYSVLTRPCSHISLLSIPQR